jgi:DNA-binding beta-propeller fold protein YncE
MIPAAVLTVAVIAAAIVITGQRHQNSNGAQITLPFTGLALPGGVALGAAGNLYVTNFHNSQVVKLAAGASTQTVVPLRPVDDNA